MIFLCKPDMKIKETTCKTALSLSKLPGLDYTLNPYIGCAHQCAYCYVPHVLHLSKEKWDQTVTIKRNIPLILSKELSHKKPGTIGISTVTDPYQPIEQHYNITRYCLVQLLQKDFPISIQTKSSLVIRDKDIISQFSHAELLVSIATMNDSYRKLLEPAASSIEQRLNILKEFSNTQVKTGVFFGPIYPTTDKEISQMVEIFSKLDVSTLIIDRFHMKPGVHNALMNATQSNPEFQKKLQHYLMQQETEYHHIKEMIASNIKETKIDLVDAF